ncbi:MAG: hypothetical protein AAF203_10975 [Pseudomonadota bacterium]
MKAIVTGHSRGLGKFLYDDLHQNDWEVIGFSKSLGTDICKKSDREKIIAASLEADLVILASRAGYCDCDLLFEMHGRWLSESHHKMIVTIGSKASVNYMTRPMDPLKYDYQKHALEKMVQTFSLDSRIRICHMNLDYLATPSILSNPALQNQAVLPLEFIADQIRSIYHTPPGVHIAHLNIWARDCDQ